MSQVGPIIDPHMLGHQICCRWTCDSAWANLNLVYKSLKMGLCVGGCGASKWEVGRERRISGLPTGSALAQELLVAKETESLAA